jgi:hypothetical protein
MTRQLLYPNPIVDELIATVASYGMAEIPADLRASLEEIALDLVEDDETASPSPSYFSTRLAS